MCELLANDIKLVEKARKEKNLPKPTEFENGRIDPALIEKLLEIIKLPFEEEAIQTTRTEGFQSKGVPYSLQLNRLQEVFGTSHIKIEHKVIENFSIEPQNEEKKTMYYSKVYVTIKIGNYTIYTDANNKPDSNFVTYYQTEGIGWGKAINKGTAEKNAYANGVKEALKNMGMLRYLYLDEEDDSKQPSFGTEIKAIRLIETPTYYEKGTLFFKCKAIDKQTGEEVTVIIYQNNNFNKATHEEMKKMLITHKALIIPGKELNVEVKENIYNDEKQYIINKIIQKKSE